MAKSDESARYENSGAKLKPPSENDEDNGKMGQWIGKATAKMKAKGTVGKFGKATPKKIASAKKKGGKLEKEAVFAQNMKKISQKRKSGGK